jgi:hypothetical protein
MRRGQEELPDRELRFAYGLSRIKSMPWDTTELQNKIVEAYRKGDPEASNKPKTSAT